MRKGVKLAGLLAVGVAAFAVACSPVCNPVPVADPHGTPEQQWNWWRETYATADYGQADLAGYTSLSDIPQCGMEDGSMAGGYELKRRQITQQLIRVDTVERLMLNDFIRVEPSDFLINAIDEFHGIISLAIRFD